MSVNVTVAVPLETVMAVQNATRTRLSDEAVVEVARGATQAVVDAIKALPYQLTPKACHEASPMATVKPPGNNITFDITFAIKSLTGKSRSLTLSRFATMMDVAEAYQDWEGVPPDQMRMIYNGKVVFCMDDAADGDTDTDMSIMRTVDEVSIVEASAWVLWLTHDCLQTGIRNGSEVHLVLKLRGT